MQYWPARGSKKRERVCRSTTPAGTNQRKNTTITSCVILIKHSYNHIHTAAWAVKSGDLEHVGTALVLNNGSFHHRRLQSSFERLVCRENGNRQWREDVWQAQPTIGERISECYTCKQIQVRSKYTKSASSKACQQQVKQVSSK